MARTRTEVLDEIVAQMDAQLQILKERLDQDAVDYQASRTLCEMGKAMSVIDRNMREKEKDQGDEAKGMTDEELEAELERALTNLRGKRGGGH